MKSKPVHREFTPAEFAFTLKKAREEAEERNRQQDIRMSEAAEAAARHEEARTEREREAFDQRIGEALSHNLSISISRRHRWGDGAEGLIEVSISWNGTVIASDYI